MADSSDFRQMYKAIDLPSNQNNSYHQNLHLLIDSPTSTSVIQKYLLILEHHIKENTVGTHFCLTNYLIPDKGLSVCSL